MTIKGRDYLYINVLQHEGFIRASQRTCVNNTNEELPHAFTEEEDRLAVCCLSDGTVFLISQLFMKDSEELAVYRSSNSGV